MKLAMYYDYKETPAGQLLLTSDGTVITGMHWSVFKRTPKIQPDWINDESYFVEASQQINEYFAGARQEFDFKYRYDGTDFQRAVWQKLEKIPFGSTTSYGKLAKDVGRPLAVRAVGTAVGSNPISITVPCHRVLSSSGGIGGYAGGLKAKHVLLKIEKISVKT